MVVAGLYDGNVMVFNLQTKSQRAVYQSNKKTGQHDEAVWNVYWQKDDLDDLMNFASVSSDGRVKQWTLLKNELICEVLSYFVTIYGQDLIKAPVNTDIMEDSIKGINLAGACSFDFHHLNSDYFVVGTEDGQLIKCSKDFIAKPILFFEVLLSIGLVI